MLRFFRHGDRRLALFNDSVEEDAVVVDLALTRSETRGQPRCRRRNPGFQRLQGGQSLVIVDTGKPPPRGFDGDAHAGTLSFELSQGRERIIVNCGGYRGAKPAWRRVARSSAAHSVLVVGDTNAVEIQADGSLGRAPNSVRCERAEEGGHQWIAATHDGYRPRFGVTYARELYLAADGDDLRGEDKLTGRSGAPFAVRFHLHPAVEASLIEDGGGALLRLASGAAWRLRASGAEMGLGESIYLGTGELRKTQQIVLSGTTGPSGATVRWAIRRETKLPDQGQKKTRPSRRCADPVLLAAIPAAAGLTACLGTRALIPLLRRAAVLDRPNERSLHEAPTPRGGGIALVGAILLAWLALIGGRSRRAAPPRRLGRRGAARGDIVGRRSARAVAGRAALGAVRRGRPRHGCPDTGGAGVSGLADARA